MSSDRIQSYNEFWPFYLREHSHPLSRVLHYVGTTVGILSLLCFLLSGKVGFLLLMLVGSYGFAWIGHFGFQKNKPATFQYPLWSLISDFRMYGLWLSGSLDTELKKAGAAV